MKYIVKKLTEKKSLFLFCNITAAVCLFLICRYAFADTGTDLLAGTDSDLMATIQGTGKKFLYAAELIIATYSFVKTRQASVFMGILALSVGFNILLKVATGV